MLRALLLICLISVLHGNCAVPAFRINTFSRTPAGQSVLTWSAETNAFSNLFFTIESASGLRSGFTSASLPISESGSLSFTDSVSSARSAIYRIAAAPAFTSLTQSGGFSAYAATNVNGLSTAGYAGAVFDGRYVYFVPYQNSVSVHGRVLRLDTQGDFNASASWAAYDATAAVGPRAAGFTGGVFDGRYVYFSPQLTTSPSGELRYDTQGNFTNASSWALYDASLTDGLSCKGFQGTVFDGRYVYYVPHFNTNAAPGGWNGVVLRYDTQAAFTNSGSWHAFDAGNIGGLPTRGYSSGVFDGRYVYFVPIVNGVQTNGSGCVLRYDTHGTFANAANWDAYDAGNTSGLISTSFKGAVFDGRYIFFAPYPNNGNCAVLRYDTQNGFSNSSSWIAFNATNINGVGTDGYDGAVYDGRFVWFVPYHTAGSVFHGRVLRYDTQAIFTNATSWQAFDAGSTGGLQTRGYVGAVSDGRYIYFAPYYNGVGSSGNVLRFDARLPRLIPSTVTGGSNL